MPHESLRISPGRAALLALMFVALIFGLSVVVSTAAVIVGLVLGQRFGLAEIAGIAGHPAALIACNTLAAYGSVATGLYLGRATWPSLWQATRQGAAVFAAFLVSVLGAVILVSEADGWINEWKPAPQWIRDSFTSLADLHEHPIASPLALIVMAAVTEEFLFRGLILRGLLRTCARWVAILISAALFMLIHMNPWQFPTAFALGVLFGWVFARTGSLWLCIAGHALNNALSLLANGLPFEIGGFNAPSRAEDIAFQPLWFDALGVALLVGGVLLFRRLAPTPVIEREPEPEPAFARPATVSALNAPPLIAASVAALPLENANSLCAPPVSSDASRQMSADFVPLVTSIAQRARAASLTLATAPTERKNAALQKLADLIDASHAALLDANARDLASPEATALSQASRERLALSEKKLAQLAASVREVIALPDPVGELLEETTRPNGIKIRKLRVPIGVIGIIYEARPNVTIDCAILCLKSGNASILRGGKECFHTNTALAGLIQRALVEAGLPGDAVQLIPTTDRAALSVLLKLDSLIHCIIPRGGETLIRYVAENSTIPVIKHYKGVCFVYVDAAADFTMAESIVVNAKASRPSVCNAAEQLLVHRGIAETFLPQVARALLAKNVQLRCDTDSAAILHRAGVSTVPATPADFTTEFLDYILAVRIVDSLELAIATINRDSSNHSDAIVTADENAARRFLASVDSATVYWNASTRFTDGFEFGYGAEIGISTDRLHARGPMGLRELCSYKFIVEGSGQVR